MKATTIFRKFDESDRGELNKMIMALYREDDYGEPMSGEKVDKTIAELQQFPEKGFITIFENEHGVVGYAITILFWSNELGGNVAEIDEFYVKPEWRSKGIGTEFLDYSANPGRRNYCRIIVQRLSNFNEVEILAIQSIVVNLKSLVMP